jgi:hypothetical protein
MARFPSLAPPASLFLLAPLLFAQNATLPTPATTPAEVRNVETETVFSPVEKLQFFALEHRAPDQIDAQDTELIKKHSRELLSETQFYGYDASTPGWSYEQSACSLMPEHILLRYASKDTAGAESIFTALVPRHGGRVWIVPVLSHGTTRFRPAPADPRNYRLFSQVVPADLAKKNSGPDGKWLLLSLCYAEMTGARPQVPNRPALDMRTIKAPPPTLRLSVSGQHEVRFVDPISPTEYRLWHIEYDANGRITAVSDGRQSFGQPVARTIPEPNPKQMPEPAVPALTQRTVPVSQRKTVQP